MSEEKIQPGDVVMLRSGGPPMTVTALEADSPTDENPNVDVLWFHEDVLSDATFPLVALRKAPRAL